jgi:type IV pilus assembly protein PilA
MRSLKKGFTLVEMMIVVAIIAVLAGVAIPQYNKYVKKSEASEGIGLMKQIIDAETVYKSTKGSYKEVTSVADLTVLNIDIPTGAKFQYFKAKECNGAILAKASTDSGYAADKSIYLASPDINITSSAEYVGNEDYFDGNSFIHDFVNMTTSGKAPKCNGTAF